jgi:hypothetical protein
MMTYPSKWRAGGDNTPRHCHLTVTHPVTRRSRKYSSFTADGDTGDGDLQGILSWKKKRGKQAEGDIATSFVTSKMRHTLRKGVTTATPRHDA